MARFWHVAFDHLPITFFIVKSLKVRSRNDVELIPHQCYADLEFYVLKSRITADTSKFYVQQFKRNILLLVGVIMYNVSDAFKMGMVLGRFLGGQFNRSLLVGDSYNKSFPDPKFFLEVRHSPANKMHADDSSSLFQGIKAETLSIVTCDGLSKEGLAAGFHDYIQPFQGSLWLTFALFFTTLVFILANLFRYQEQVESAWLIIFSFLLEQCLTISRKLEASRQFRIIFAGFLLMCVVLTNGYKGVVTTSLVKPFDFVGFQAIDEFLKDTFKLYYITYDKSERYRSRCCNESKLGFTPRCKRDMITIVLTDRFFFLYGALGFFDIRRFDKFYEELVAAGGEIKSVRPEMFLGVNASATDHKLLDLVKLLEPPPCDTHLGKDQYDNMYKQLLTCHKTLFTTSTDEINELMLKAELDPITYKRLYKLPDTKLQETIPSLLIGYRLHMVTYLKDIFRSPSRAFLESGVASFTLGELRWKRRLALLKNSRSSPDWGKALLNDGPKKLALDDKAGIAFVLFVACVIISSASLFSEVIPFNKCTMLLIHAGQTAKCLFKKWFLPNSVEELKFQNVPWKKYANRVIIINRIHRRSDPPKEQVS